jgi:hypothetical protein
VYERSPTTPEKGFVRQAGKRGPTTLKKLHWINGRRQEKVDTRLKNIL